jgi:hypothetical protein
MTVSPQWIAISFHFTARYGHPMSIACRRLLVLGLALAIAPPFAAGASLTVDVKIPLGDIAAASIILHTIQLASDCTSRNWATTASESSI